MACLCFPFSPPAAILFSLKASIYESRVSVLIFYLFLSYKFCFCSPLQQELGELSLLSCVSPNLPSFLLQQVPPVRPGAEEMNSLSN